MLQLLILVATALFFTFFAYPRVKLLKSGQISPSKSNKHIKPYVKPIIKPVPPDFQWDKTPPLKSYPFKNSDYKLTMGIRNLDAQQWLLVEPSYLRAIGNKKKIVTNTHPDYPSDKDLASNTVLFTDEAVPAIKEFYNIVVNYMCEKYPMYFKMVENKLYNDITKEYIPTKAGDEFSAREYMLYLANTIEEDFLILLKDPTRVNEKDGSEYFFKAGIFAFAAGFAPVDRFNKPLSFVHHPIPGYESKLKLSMNRFFNRIEPGQFVTRSNFSVQTHNKYYVDDANKGHNLSKNQKQAPLDPSKLDFENQVHYRSERQTLTRLPESGAIVFTVRTYLEPLSVLKKEEKEVRERFIGAIDKLPKDISEYKRADEWGPAVIAYLLDDL